MQKGFTIIEVLVSSALLVLLGAGFLGLQYIFSKNQTIAWQSYLNIEEANRAVMTLSRELRNARESEDGRYPLEIANDQEIVFYSDTNFDGTTERIRYTKSANELIKGTIEPVGDPAAYPLNSEIETVITEFVRNGTDPIFYYYDKNWPGDTTNNPLSTDRISQTRVVKVSLIINTKDDPSSDYHIETESKIRMIQE